MTGPSPCSPMTEQPVAFEWRKKDSAFASEPWSYVDYNEGILIKQHPEKYEVRPLYTRPATPAPGDVGKLAQKCRALGEKLQDVKIQIGSSPYLTFIEAADALERLSAVTVTWQPIETAPKDGTHVLVGTFPAPPGYITVATAHWFDSRMYGAKSGGAGWALSVNYDGEHSHHGVDKPTHWMPVPAGPVE